MRAWIRVACGLAALTAWQVAAAEGPAQAASLADALAVIQSHRFVDLTHSFAPGIPHWKGAPNERVKTLYTVEKMAFGSTSTATSASGARTSIRRRIFMTDCIPSIRSTRRTC